MYISLFQCTNVTYSVRQKSQCFFSQDFNLFKTAVCSVLRELQCKAMFIHTNLSFLHITDFSQLYLYIFFINLITLWNVYLHQLIFPAQHRFVMAISLHFLYVITFWIVYSHQFIFPVHHRFFLVISFFNLNAFFSQTNFKYVAKSIEIFKKENKLASS